MTDTTSVSPKPGIKCYVRDNITWFDETAEETLEKVRTVTGEEWLWTGESVYCICTHHVEQHCTIRDEYGFVVTIQCHGDNGLCCCEHFRPARKLKKSKRRRGAI